MKRSLVVVVLAVLLATITIALLWSTGLEKYTTTVRVAMGTLQGGISTLDVAEKLGIGREYGVELSVARFAKTPDILTALAKNEIDGAIIPAEMAAKLIQKGVDLRIIAVDMMQNQAIITMRDGIESPEDLRGKLVAAVVPSGTYRMFKAYMKTVYGIDVVEEPSPVEGKIAVVNVPPGSILVALEKNEVDAVVIWEPFVSKALVKGGRIVASYQDLWEKSGAEGEPVMLVWVVTGRFAEQHPGVVEKLAKIQVEAAEKWVKDKNLVESILTGPLYKLSPEEAEKLYSRVVVNTRPLDNGLVESIREVWRLAWQGGYLEEDPDEIPGTVFIEQG